MTETCSDPTRAPKPSRRGLPGGRFSQLRSRSQDRPFAGVADSRDAPFRVRSENREQASIDPTDIPDWTIERYNRAVARVSAYRSRFVWSIVTVVAIGAGISVLLLKWTALSDLYGRVTFLPAEFLVVLWLFPLPALLWRAFTYAGKYRPRPLAFDSSAGTGHHVIFQVTTTGAAAETVRHTVESVLYWSNRLHPAFIVEAQVVVEPAGYNAHRQVYDELGRRGATITVVPPDYITRNGSVRKSRALHYAAETRRLRGSADHAWIYHQDDETAIGEDTLAGIGRFLAENGEGPTIGAGIILYSQHMEDWRPSAVADLNRTKDDVASLYSLTRSNRASQFHGSHYIVRADVEQAIGFDVGHRLSVIDDLSFEVKARERYGNLVRWMDGFAYEQSPLTWRDQVRQRRRWVVGLKAAESDLSMPAVRKLSLGYYLVAWALGSASTFTVGLPLLFNFSALLPFGMAFSALSWGIMVEGYLVGYAFHVEYVPGPRSIARAVWNGICGAFVDSFAVWIGLAARNGGQFRIIEKDVRVPVRTPTQGIAPESEAVA